ncbi:hypothetical protein CPS_2967 [Colwellia psychrerythraea 34H]|uniref:Uncharacterized protein n=1 Tax=Colwellia psychrerythraea (strain 34H / ATCC BAA-681) TaxID=167879 RepID=Q47ZV2_COLP3|nr:hypothetical protein CPS_2967 [Colwellia psychrerythraea 34H]
MLKEKLIVNVNNAHQEGRGSRTSSWSLKLLSKVH